MQRTFLWLGLALASTLVLLHPGFDASEGSDHLRVALHLLETGHLGIETSWSGIFQRGTDGRFYTAHELGNTLWLLPAAASGLVLEHMTGMATVAGIRTAELPALLMPPLFATLTALAFAKLLEWGFAVPGRTRFSLTLVLVFGTMLLPYARSLNDVVATGCWVAWGAAFSARAATGEDLRSALAAGLCLGAAFLTRLPSGVAILPIFVWMLAIAPRERRRSLAVVSIAGGLPALAGVFWFNDLRTGSPFLTAVLHPQYAISQPGSGSLFVGVPGLLLSPGKGLLFFSPAFIVAAMGLGRMWREARGAALMVMGSLALFLVAHGSLYSWHGDWGWGPRYFVFVLPLLWLPAVFAIDRLRRSATARRTAVALIAASVLIQAAAIVTHWHYLYQVRMMEGRMRAGMHWALDNQLTDSLRHALPNVARTFSAGAPVDAPSGLSPLTVLAATGINVWWVTALRAGFPPWLVSAAAGLLALVAAVSWRRAIASVRREDPGGRFDLGLAG